MASVMKRRTVGTAAAKPRVRVPEIIVPPYNPPPPSVDLPSGGFAQAPRSVSTSDEVEAVTLPVVVDQAAGEQVLFTTSRPWLACDVFLRMNVPFVNVAGVCSVATIRVYAEVAGRRFLVASGRRGNNVRTPGAASDGSTNEWCCAVRGIPADRFTVTFFYSGDPGGIFWAAVQQPQAEVSIIASNRALAPPRWLGVVPAEEIAGSAVDIAATQFPDGQLYGFAAANDGAAIAYVVDTSAAVNNQVAIAVPPGEGVELFDWNPRLGSGPYTGGFLRLRLSTSPLGFVAGATGSLVAWVR
jgi:hypothetical protein